MCSSNLGPFGRVRVRPHLFPRSFAVCELVGGSGLERVRGAMGVGSTHPEMEQASFFDDTCWVGTRKRFERTTDTKRGRCERALRMGNCPHSPFPFPWNIRFRSSSFARIGITHLLFFLPHLCLAMLRLRYDDGRRACLAFVAKGLDQESPRGGRE